MKIGVFDSGVGGLSVARAIQAALPEADVIFVNDSQHMPYGTKPPDEIYRYVEPIFEKLINDGCRVIVVACNTVSTTLIQRLRAQFTTVPLIAMEPMVKPAAGLTKTGIITVCATPATLGSQRYAWLKQTYAPGKTILEPDCSDWSYLIEHDRLSDAKIRQNIEPALTAGSDVIVLGCTHYHWIEDEIREIVGDKAVVLQPEQPVIAQLRKILER